MACLVTLKLFENTGARGWGQFAATIIPGRAEGASPESRCALIVCIWIPGPALRAVPE
jgi:hypothetical protein